MQEIQITLSGRIPNYLFGNLKQDYFEECTKAIEFTSDKANSVGEFLSMVYDTTLDNGFDNFLEIFKENIDFEKFKANCPLLYEFINGVESGDYSYYQFYEMVLEASDEEIHFIEDDVLISITVNNEKIILEQRLRDFLGDSDWLDESDENSMQIVKSFWKENRTYFDLHPDTNEFNAYKCENDVLLLSEWIAPEQLKPYLLNERNVTVQHDNIVDFNFYFEVEDFKLSHLGFLQFGGGEDFHESAAKYIGSYLFYNNLKLESEIIIHRDKGFTIEYEPEWKSCTFLIEG
ncbi:MAG: hypothetical protein CL827_08665 [Crocinitomicaceae bacterium]|nr:hypothetical protein [Crocinitomicaceae bacterium]|tara:strand:- start:201 stop:1070 length:870 start_codon:yes stop_codon:yes gene_type:complete